MKGSQAECKNTEIIVIGHFAFHINIKQIVDDNIKQQGSEYRLYLQYYRCLRLDASIQPDAKYSESPNQTLIYRYWYMS